MAIPPQRILYLDQNAWIHLAQGIKEPDKYPQFYEAVEVLVREAKKGQIQVPLSFTNIYEIHKINHHGRRKYLAWVMATLSHGRVFRGRKTVIREQIVDFLLNSFGRSKPARPDAWFLSDLHFESVADYGPATFKVDIPNWVLESLQFNPTFALFHYLTMLDDETRKAAISKYSVSSRSLLEQIERRRSQILNETMDMRKRIYSAQIVIDNIDQILGLCKKMDLPVTSMSDLGEKRVLALVEEIPVFNIERDLQLKTEAENRSLEENDLRDVSSFYSILPYADIFVAEKAFINRARQARHGERYNTTLLTSVAELPRVLAN